MLKAPAYTVCFEDAWLLAVTKPPGWETIVQGGTGGKCLTTALQKDRGLPDLAPAHRLDRDTTGVQLLGKDAETVERLHQLFRERAMRKWYLGVCLGVPRNAQGTIRRRLSKWGGGRRAVQVVKGRGGLEAETGYTRLAFTLPQGGPLFASLLLFQPHHGRTHQVRVHAAALGYPILGDDQYGDRSANRVAKETAGLRRQGLHAWRLAFRHPQTGTETRIEAPLPQDVRKLCDASLPDWEQVLSAVGWD